jgi:hypothetical protein
MLPPAFDAPPVGDGNYKANTSNDPRNGRAAEQLEQLASEASGLSDEPWDELRNYYSWSSGTWSHAVSLASRHVEFRNIKTFPALLNDLLCILAEQHVAA